MAVVHIPAPLRQLTGGESQVTVEGATLRQVVDALEAAHPGIRARLVEGDRLRPGLAVFVDNVQADAGLRTPVKHDSQIYLAPAIAGGTA